jgi:hypothetical protein
VAGLFVIVLLGQMGLAVQVVVVHYKDYKPELVILRGVLQLLNALMILRVAPALVGLIKVVD